MDQKQQEALCYLILTPLNPFNHSHLKGQESGARRPGWNELPQATERKVEKLGLHPVPGTPSLSLHPSTPARASPAPARGLASLGLWDVLDIPLPSCEKVFPGPQECHLIAGSSNI